MNRGSLISLRGALLVMAFASAAPWSLPQATAQQPSPALTPQSIPVTYQGRTIQLDAWLSIPSGAGPFTAVILAHGCNGVNPDIASSAWVSMNKWAQWLNQEGYAALILDSFTARGLRGVCRDQGVEIAVKLMKLIPVDVRALDIYMAAAYLAKMPHIDPREFAAIGFSHGGATIVRAAANDNDAVGDGKAALAAHQGKLAAVVGVYPGCRGSIWSTFSAPLLILIGTADERTPADICQRLASHTRSEGSPVTIKVYPGATHSFDVEKPERRTKLGDTLRYSADVTADARTRIKDFFNRYLTAR